MIPFGSKQAMAIHKNLGGKRTVDMMGPDPDPIKWTGLFYGPTASQRVRLLEALKDTGVELRLSWGSFNYLVVISHFVAAYKHEWEIHYEITVEISTTASVTPFPVLEKILNSSWAAALAVPGLSGEALSAITTAQTAVNAVAQLQPNGVLSNAGLVALSPAIAAAVSGFNAVDGLLRSAQSGIAGIDLDVARGNSTLEGFNIFQSEASAIAAASSLLTARGYLGNIVGNLTSLGG